MNKKLKIFYIIDITVMLISMVGIVIVENQKTYGLAALTSVGYFVILSCIFIMSLIMLVIVSLIYFIKNKKKVEEK